MIGKKRKKKLLTSHSGLLIHSHGPKDVLYAEMTKM